MRRRRVLATVAALLLLLCLLTVVYVQRERQQYQWNRALIAAIIANDTNKAIALLDAGAGPNTREETDAPPSFWQLIRNLFTRHHHKAANGPTALLLAVNP